MTKCSECSGAISTLAATCPHCGAPNALTSASAPGAVSPSVPPASKKLPAKKSGGGLTLWIFILVVVVIVAINLSTGSKPSPAAKATQDAAASQKTADADAACKINLQCWGEKNLVAASVYCADKVEHLSKYSMRWTDGTLELKFSRFKWLDKDAGTLTYFGDKAEFQNGFGAYQAVIYRCDLNPTTNAVLYVEAEPGRL